MRSIGQILAHSFLKETTLLTPLPWMSSLKKKQKTKNQKQQQKKLLLKLPSL